MALDLELHRPGDRRQPQAQPSLTLRVRAHHRRLARPGRRRRSCCGDGVNNADAAVAGRRRADRLPQPRQPSSAQRDSVGAVLDQNPLVKTKSVSSTSRRRTRSSSASSRTSPSIGRVRHGRGSADVVTGCRQERRRRRWSSSSSSVLSRKPASIRVNAATDAVQKIAAAVQPAHHRAGAVRSACSSPPPADLQHDPHGRCSPAAARSR